MQPRQLGPFTVSPIGLGCMNLSHAYGTAPSRAEAERLLLHALDSGVDHFDTAALYGFGANESLLGEVLAGQRSRFTLASKCGMSGVRGDDGVTRRVIDGRPATLRATCEAALRRLRTDVIDLYYLHRWDKAVPIEESIGALADLVSEGNIRAIGLSEVSAATLRRAHAVHPIAAVQVEYSAWTRNPEIGLLDACRNLGVALVAFSPLGRGFLAGALDSVASVEALPGNDIRRGMPRFLPPALQANLDRLGPWRALAEEHGMTMAQLALVWVLARGRHVLAIPGTRQIVHLDENLMAADMSASPGLLARVDALVNRDTIQGARYPAATQAEIDTEEF